MLAYNIKKVGHQYQMRDGSLSLPFPDLTNIKFKSGKNKGKLNHKKAIKIAQQWIIDNALLLAERTNNNILRINANELKKELELSKGNVLTSSLGDIEFFIWSEQTKNELEV